MSNDCDDQKKILKYKQDYLKSINDKIDLVERGIIKGENENNLGNLKLQKIIWEDAIDKTKDKINNVC